jgi:hypothetical protein
MIKSVTSTAWQISDGRAEILRGWRESPCVLRRATLFGGGFSKAQSIANFFAPIPEAPSYGSRY